MPDEQPTNQDDFRQWLDANIPPQLQQPLIDAQNAWIDAYNRLQEVGNDPILGPSAQAAVARAEQNKARVSEQVATQLYRAATKTSNQTPEATDRLVASAEALRASAALNQARLNKLDAQTDIQKSRADAYEQEALARAKQLGAITGPLVAEHQARTGLIDQQAAYTQARTGLVNAQTAKTQYQTDTLMPAQADDLVAKGLLTRAQADYVTQSGGAKIADLQAKFGLDQARTDQIRQRMQTPTTLTGSQASNKDAYIVSRDPQTGQLHYEPNPNFMGAQAAGFQRWEQSIEMVRQMQASGQMSQPEADQYMTLLRGSLEAELRGSTIDAEQKQAEAVEQNQATAGRDLLASRATAARDLGQNMADLYGRMKVLNVPEGIAPFAHARQDVTQMMGGQSVFDRAQQAVERMMAYDPMAARHLDTLIRTSTAATGHPFGLAQGTQPSEQPAAPSSATPGGQAAAATPVSPAGGGSAGNRGLDALLAGMHGPGAGPLPE